jgi:hypothetical protein
MILTEDNFDEVYLPKTNHLVQDAPFDGTMFETFGKELDYILSMVNELRNHNRVWTIIDGDDGLSCIAGYHLVNRIGYIVTAKPWETGTEEFRFVD